MPRYWFNEEPEGDAYRALIQYGLLVCDQALVVVQPRLGLAQHAREVIDRLEPWITQRTNSHEWPGTTLLGGEEAEVIHIRLDFGCAEILMDAAAGLFGWQQPDLPEDLCMLRSTGEDWLVTIAHEREAYLLASRSEFKDLAERVPDLRTITEEESTPQN